MPGGWEPLDPESEEAKKAAKLALDWYNEASKIRRHLLFRKNTEGGNADCRWLQLPP